MKKRNGFTLIELLAVIVILAIIALIATPMVLKYIKTSKEGSYDTSINNILRAAENYYASSLLDNKTVYPKTFNFPKNKELGIKGKQPDSGYLTIYSDGSTNLYAVYDDIIYTKLPTETKASRYNMVVGDEKIWTTNGKGAITKYNEDYMASAEGQTEMFVQYLNISVQYASRDENTGLDYTKSLRENVQLLEQEEGFDRSLLPLDLNKEIDYILDLYNVELTGTDEEKDTKALNLLLDNATSIPNYADYYNVMSDSGNIEDVKAYQLILNNLKTSNIFVIPNYVKHEDGTLEKITTIDTYTFRSQSIYGAFECFIAPESDTQSGKDLIIPEGIENINGASFQVCLLNSVSLPNTLKVIGESGFAGNKLKTIILPSTLGTIGKQAFAGNNLEGELVISDSVKIIDKSAFDGDELYSDCNNITDSSVLKACQSLKGVKNNITSLKFTDNSQIETIGEYAFAKNSLTTVTLPKSIKSIGQKAFECPTLTSAIIKADSSNVTLGHDAFGSIQPTFES